MFSGVSKFWSLHDFQEMMHDRHHMYTEEDTRALLKLHRLAHASIDATGNNLHMVKIIVGMTVPVYRSVAITTIPQEKLNRILELVEYVQ